MGLKHLPVTVLAVCVVSVGGTGFAEEGPPRDPPPESITEAECDLAFPFDRNKEGKEYARCLADEPSGDPLAPLVSLLEGTGRVLAVRVWTHAAGAAAAAATRRPALPRLRLPR